MKNIISQDWLLENMLNEDLVILDARAGLSDPETGIRAYEEGHIKGSQFISMETVMSSQQKQGGGRNPLPKLEKFRDDMKNFGVSDSSTVVIYDDGSLGMAAGRVWWLLKYIGKKDVFLLEGGISKWIENGLELTKEVEEVKPSKDLSLNIDSSIFADIDDVKRAIEDDKAVIVDCRAFARYSGQEEPHDRIPGHIPSAINYPSSDLVLDGTIMEVEKLKEHFQKLKKYDEIILHCGSGISATVNLLLLEEIGIKAKLFPGSYSEWVSDLDNPVI